MIMKRFFLLAVLSFLVAVAVVPVLAQNKKPGADSKPDKMEMDRPMMAMPERHHDEMGPPMRMTTVRSIRAGDEQRAAAVVQTARQVLEKYRDYKTALADGFEIFMPNVSQPMYHFSNYRYALEAENGFNAEHPTSLLYEKQGAAYKLIGAMYTASARFSEAELDQRIPLSIAQWHQHVNLCMPPGAQRAEMLKPNTRFGMRGSIATKEECEKAGGSFVPRLFGWMVHVYPFEQTSSKTWSPERQMQDAMEMEPATAPRSGTSTGNGGVVAAGTQAPPTPTAPIPSSTPTSAVNATVRQSIGSFKSESKEISFELFEPVAPGKYPGVVMLYGSGGMTAGGPLFRVTAEALAREGYVVYLPHYFEKTGTQFATRDDDVKYFATWMRTIADTIDQAKSKANVDSKRIGLIGFSLGAYLSLSVASVDNEVKAVVEYFGGLPEFFSKQLRSMPPTLILHGDADRTVPVSEAYNLETLLKGKKAPYEIKIYTQQGHGFSGSAAADAMQRTVAFFEKNLKGI
jgi:dienelactone hydrolase